MIGFDLSAYGAHVSVEGAYADDDGGGKAQTGSPFGAKGTGGLIGSVCLGEEPCGKAFQKGIERGEEFVGREPAGGGFCNGGLAEFFCPEGFVAGGANASFHFGDVSAACQKEGYPIAMFDPGIAGGSNVIIYSKDMQQFSPEPFGGIDAADELQVVGIVSGGVCIDFSGFFHGGMVFPQDELGIGVFTEGGKQAQRRTGFIDGHR